MFKYIVLSKKIDSRNYLALHRFAVGILGPLRLRQRPQSLGVPTRVLVQSVPFDIRTLTYTIQAPLSPNYNLFY